MPIINGIYRPDFEANTQLPGWTPMGEDNNQAMGQNIGKIGASFKDRLMSGAGDSKDTMSGAAGKAGGGGAGGAFKSLG